LLRAARQTLPEKRQVQKPSLNQRMLVQQLPILVLMP
jgi:hypothetical protein